MNPRNLLNEANRGWRPPQELLRSRPREVELTGIGKLLAGLAILLLVGGAAAGVLLYVKAVTDREEHRLILEKGASTDGIVLRRWMTRGDHPGYWIEIAYRTGQTSLRATARISQDMWHRLRDGSVVEIHYLPVKPKRFLLAGEAPDLVPIWLSIAVSGTLLVSSFGVRRVLSSQRRLLEEGRPALAVVTGHKATKDGKVVRYVFVTLGGAIVSGRSGPTKSPPPVGGFQCVLYEPDRARHNSAYPLKLVRTARPFGQTSNSPAPKPVRG